MASEREVHVKPSQQDGFVYVAEAGGDRIKIGWTTEPSARIRRIESAIADELYVWACVPGSRDDESAVHELWRSAALGREWFHASDAMREWAESVEDAGSLHGSLCQRPLPEPPHRYGDSRQHGGSA